MDEVLPSADRAWPGWFRVAAVATVAYALLLAGIAARVAHAEWAAEQAGTVVSWLRLYANLPAAWFGRVIGMQNFSAFLVGQALEVVLLFCLVGFFTRSLAPRAALRSRAVVIILLLALAGGVVAAEYHYFGPYPARCDRFVETWMGDQCRVGMGSARQPQPDACDGDSMCVLNMAWSMQDLSMCDQVPDADLRATCVAWVQGDEALCQNVPDLRYSGSKLVSGYRILCLEGIKAHERAQ